MRWRKNGHASCAERHNGGRYSVQPSFLGEPAGLFGCVLAVVGQNTIVDRSGHRPLSQRLPQRTKLCLKRIALSDESDGLGRSHAEGCFERYFFLSLALSPLVPRGAREKRKRRLAPSLGRPSCGLLCRHEIARYFIPRN